MEYGRAKVLGEFCVDEVCSGCDFVGRRSLEVKGKVVEEVPSDRLLGLLRGEGWAAGRYTHVPNFQVQTRCMTVSSGWFECVRCPIR